MIIALYTLSGALLLATTTWLFRIFYSYKILKRQRHAHSRNAVIDASLLPIRIILPVLGEQERLAEFASYFTTILLKKSPALELWIVTTEREKKEYPNSATIKLARALNDSHDSIHHIHCPYTKGVMAHQLNYAIENIPTEGLYAIYNADSRPEPDTFSWVAQHYDNTNQMIFQQYGIYTKNYSYVQAQKMRSLLISNMYWQSRWALGFEYYRAASARQRKRWPASFRALNYCIGHGLFIPAELIKEMRFSETTTNEDAVLGLEATLRDVAIQPVPYFDLSESPDSVSSIYHQKTNWFQGPLQAPLYYHILRAKYPAVNALYIALGSLKLFAHAVYWIAGPAIIITCIFMALFLSLSHPSSLIFVLAPLVFLILPALITHASLKRLRIDGYPPSQNKNFSIRLVGNLLIGSVSSYLIHGLAGGRGLFMARRILHGVKMKTNMMQYKES